MKNQKDFLRELARTLKKDGRFIITIEYAANYEVHRQTFPHFETNKIISFTHALGLTIHEIKILTYEGTWVHSINDGFSMWIFGRKD